MPIVSKLSLKPRTAAAHRANFTAVSPPLYNIAMDGSFGRIAGEGSGSYADLYPHVRELQAIGLEVHPLIAGPPNIQGQEAMIRDPKRYIEAAVAEAVRNEYNGYNFDNVGVPSSSSRCNLLGVWGV